jgi:hypothetical protein
VGAGTARLTYGRHRERFDFEICCDGGFEREVQTGVFTFSRAFDLIHLVICTLAFCSLKAILACQQVDDAMDETYARIESWS